MHAILANNRIEISFKFDWDILDIVKSIPGREFHNEGNSKYWVCPLSEIAIRTLLEAGFDCEKELKDFLRKSEITETDIKELEVPGLKKELFPFQKKGVSFIEAKNGNCILGDEMGLGKTIQALAWVHLHPELKPVIVVCPAHLKLNWAQEIEETLPGKQNVQILYGTDFNQLLYGEIIILNYEILANSYEKYEDTLGKKRYREIKLSGWVDYLIKINPQILIIDEAHYVKSPKAFRTKSVKKLARKSQHRMGLTGTPITNKPIEGYYITQAIDKNIFPDFWHFVHHFCDAKHNGFGWDYSGSSNKHELYEKLQSVMIRRKKKNVLPELPDKVYSYVPMELSNRKEYNEAKRNFFEYIIQTKGPEGLRSAQGARHLVEIEILKQLCVKGKMDSAIQWIHNFVENNADAGKLIIFTTHTAVVNILMKEFKNIAVKVDGSVKAIQKKEAEIFFQNNDKIRILVGNIQAAGTGLNLTAASAVAFLELPWTPGELVQAEDRAHRIGQKDSVNIYFLLADRTIEGKIVKLLDEKKKVIEAVLDGKDVEDIALLAELIQSYEKEIGNERR